MSEHAHFSWSYPYIKELFQASLEKNGYNLEHQNTSSLTHGYT